jgi:ABC-2 type transport system ATP-binding protein
MDAIETTNLAKEYRVGFWGEKVRVLADLSLHVDDGEIFGYLGPNGAGKTTTLKLLMGLVQPTSGEARILGQPLHDVAMKQQVGFLPEQPYFYDYLTGRELLNFYGQLVGLSRSDRRDRVYKLAGRLRIESALDLPLRKYSKGMLQRIGLIQALLNDPTLLLLDEPMSGLDPIGRREVRDLLLELKAEGKTIFFSSHVIPDVEMVCDRVGILVGGHLVASGRLEELLGTEMSSIEVMVSLASSEVLKELDHLLLTQPAPRGERVLLTVKDEGVLADLLSRLGETKAVIHSIVPNREGLEEYFLRHISPKPDRESWQEEGLRRRGHEGWRHCPQHV